jgi:hypothetical protein
MGHDLSGGFAYQEGEGQGFEAASAEEREKAILKALNAAKHEPTILSPAE